MFLRAPNSKYKASLGELLWDCTSWPSAHLGPVWDIYLIRRKSGSSWFPGCVALCQNLHREWSSQRWASSMSKSISEHNTSKLFPICLRLCRRNQGKKEKKKAISKQQLAHSQPMTSLFPKLKQFHASSINNQLEMQLVEDMEWTWALRRWS